MNDLAARGQSVRAHLLLVTLVLILGGSTRAGTPPDVVRVRVPSARVSAYFPPGATVRTLTPDRFEELVAGAKAEPRSPLPPGARAPIRVEHQGRWDGQALAGRSTVTLPATLGADQPSVIELDPWSPALLDSPDRLDHVRVNASGRLILIQAANQPARTVELRWSQAAQADSLGQVFALHLPEADVATLALDLPAGMIATVTGAAPGSRRELPPGADSDRTRCEFSGAEGRFALQLHPSTATNSATPLAWVGGTTRIDLNSTAANWIADWRIEANSGALIRGSFDLDSSLELIDVVGPDVRSFRLEGDDTDHPSGHSRVEVTFRTPESTVARVLPLTIRAQALVPLAGVWSLPSARPVGALGWLGGRTEIRLDPARAVVATVERSGRRVEARPDESGPPAPWIFEATNRPGPLADLTLAPPRPDASVAIDGTLRLGAFAPKVEVLATWTVGRGGFLAPTLDFPASWVIDQVVGGDGRANIPWHSERIEGGGSRVHLDGSAWPTELPGRSILVRLAATRINPPTVNGDSALGLPRVLPAGSVRVAAERWVAVLDPGWEAVPTEGQGLVWDDPAPGSAEATELMAAANAEQRLAWRWVADGAGVGPEARMSWHRSARRPRLDERLEAVISGGRLRLVWHWSLDGVDRPASLPFHLEIDPTSAPRWRLMVRSGGPVVEPQSLAVERRTNLGFPPTGLAAEISTRSLPAGPITLRGEAEMPWSGSGSIPLVDFPSSVLVRRSVVVRVADATRLRVGRVEGLSPVARGEVGDPSVTPGSESSPYRTIIGDGEPGLRVAGAWLGEENRCELALTTEGEPGDLGPAGVITEATLTSRLSPGSATRHRLVLRVAPGSTRTLSLKLPAGATLDRVRRDGQPAVVTTDGSELQVVLTQPDPRRLTSTTTFDYRTAADPASAQRIHPAALLPTTSLACLSFTWQVNAPDRFEVRSESPDLVATDLADLIPALGDEATEAESTVNATMLADLDKALIIAPPTESSLGEWLTKLDAGRWPILVDRQALLSVGLGPRSRVNVVPTDPTRPELAPAVFSSLGLAVEPIGAALLVTTESDRRIGGGESNLTLAERAALGSVLFDASIAGSDPTDRYQAPSRWRGEPTPRAWLVSETPDRGLIAVGWRTHRFAATGWPTAATTLTLEDSGFPWRETGLSAAGVAVIVLLAGSVRVAVRRGGGRFLIPLGVGFALVGPASAQLDPVEPIIAVLPYDDLAQVELAPDRVLILATDYDRLLGRTRSSQPVLEEANLVDLIHRLTRPDGGRSWVVETRGSVEVSGPDAGSWSIPVGPSLDLSVTIAGRPTPIQISDDGRTATVESIPAGRSNVVWRRSVPVAAGGNPLAPDGGSIRLPIPRAAFARIEIVAGDGAGPIELPGLVGARRPLIDGFAGELGPVEMLDVREGTVEPARGTRPDLTGVIRWDAEPVGDRLEARWTLAGPGPVGSLRLGLEPGLAVIGQTIPGLVGVTMDGTVDRPEWVAHVDPPLRAGATGELIFWRPRPARSTGPERPIPRWDLINGRWTGLVGCRVAAGWSGRLDGPGGANPLGPADFDRAWKSTSTDGLKLVGVKRWSPGRAFVAEVAPEAPGFRTSDRVGMQVVAGSAELTIDATLTDSWRSIWEANAVFDGPLHLVRVDGVGLKSWLQAGPNRVRLVFDGSKPSRERSVHLEGVAAVAANPADPAVSIKVPWPRWTGAEVDPGTLTVEAPDGWSIRSGGAPLIATMASPTARTYPIGSLDRSIRLVGTAVAPRVNVVAISDVRLEVERAVWTAEVACEVAGGPVRVLFWQLPTAWAESARLTLADGTDADLAIQPEVRGESTFWTITLARPIWGRRALRIEAARPLPRGQVIDYPEVVPLATPGRGEVDRYDLSITNVTGSALTLINPTGLTPLNHSRVRSEASAVPGGVVSRAYRVTGEPWSLGLQLDAEVIGGPIRSGEADSERRLAHVERVDMRLTLDSEARVGGRAECLVGPGGAFLAVQLANGASLTGAMVEGKPTRPVHLATGTGLERWLIPLGDTSPRQVVFGWVQPGASAATDPAGDRIIPLPGFADPAIPTTLQVAATMPHLDLIPIWGNWARLRPAAASLGRFERLGADLIAAIGRADRDPTSADGLALLEDLVSLELDRRAFDRRARIAGGGSESVDGWQTTRDRVRAAIVDAGLGSLLAEADKRVGQVPTEFDVSGVGPPEEATDPCRIRRIGSEVAFAGTTDADPSKPFSLVIERRKP